MRGTIRAALTVAVVCIFGLCAQTARAQSTLSNGDIAGIASAITTAISDAVDALPPDADRGRIDGAVADAIASVTKTEVGKYGTAAAGTVAAAAITAATDAGASATAVGRGMALAALEEGMAAGRDIANSVGSVGTSEEITAFDETVRANDRTVGEVLASAADSAVEIAQGGTGSLVSPAGDDTIGGPTKFGGGRSCNNPSCT